MNNRNSFMSFATARPTRSASSARYLIGYAVVDFRDGRPAAPHPVIVRTADGLMVPCTHNRQGRGAVALPPNWAGDGDRQVAWAKPAHQGRYPLTRRTEREGLRSLRREMWDVADKAFA